MSIWPCVLGVGDGGGVSGCVCVHLAIVALCVYFGFLFDLRKLRGGTGLEGRVSLD